MTYELIIVGAGIAGLTAARMAAEKGVENVLLLDYQKAPGGFTRPYWEESSFAQEAELLNKAENLPYEIKTQSTVVGFFPGEPHQLYVQSPEGTYSVEAKRLLIASGALEKPREAHRIPGSRPAGVMTPMMALQLLERGYQPGNRIVLMESGRITGSAAALLKKHAGELLTFSGAEWEVTGVTGFSRLEGITLKNRENGIIREQECDTLIFAKGRIPSTFFLKGTQVERDHHGAIVVDENGRTNLPHVYAAGSCTSMGDDDHGNSVILAEQAMRHLLQE
ncbi:NAD(P)/FAD-dependent oxidoreductase [Brevibacillus sp. H7]|uniref:NAD(P)/FAD-dependent oxidoreductase n=1 Tax=Brevibacillus sp. H7 TaxID=3349138 RepID=UPI00382B411F